MKLAMVVRTGGIWALINPPSYIDKPPIGTIVQYKQSVDGGYDVYFPGILGYAPMYCGVFWEYFEPL